MNSLAERILACRATATTRAWASSWTQYGTIGAQLQADLDRLKTRGIPVDIIFEQGTAVLGL